MIERPIVHNDEWVHDQHRQKLTKKAPSNSPSKRSLSVSHKTLTLQAGQDEGRIGRFRYTDTQDERVNKGLQKNAIYDPVPNENIDQTFLKVMRRR